MIKQGKCCKKVKVFCEWRDASRQTIYYLASRSDIAGIYEYSRQNEIYGTFIYERRGLVKSEEELFVLEKSEQTWYIANQKESVVAFVSAVNDFFHNKLILSEYK